MTAQSTCLIWLLQWEAQSVTDHAAQPLLEALILTILRLMVLISTAQQLTNEFFSVPTKFGVA